MSATPMPAGAPDVMATGDSEHQTYLDLLQKKLEERAANPNDPSQSIDPDRAKQFYTWEQIVRDPKLWVSLLWQAMSRKGKGYKTPSLRHTGRGEDRRKDKLEGPVAGVSKFFRSYAGRAGVPIKQSPRQKRRARAAAGMGR